MINDFLREIGHLKGEFRKAVAFDPGLTFSATVGHLCRAIRKLAAGAPPAAFNPRSGMRNTGRGGAG